MCLFASLTSSSVVLFVFNFCATKAVLKTVNKHVNKIKQVLVVSLKPSMLKGDTPIIAPADSPAKKHLRSENSDRQGT